MSFRSQEEIQMAQALHQQGLTFFANSQGMTELAGLPVTADTHGMVERLLALVRLKRLKRADSMP